MLDMGTMIDAYEAAGISGLTRWGTVSRVYEEFLRELQGPQGMKSLREMSDNCPISGAILFAANHLSRKVDFDLSPANTSNKAKYIADMIGSMLFDDMDSTWPDTLSEILTMLPFGWALLEFRMKRRLGQTGPTEQAQGDDSLNFQLPGVGSQITGAVGYKTPEFSPSRFNDGLIGFRSWSLRSQETLYMWEFDEESNAMVMQQMAPPDYKIRRIPLSKALLFRTQVSKNNPEGRSILRNGWTSYYFKKNLQVFEGIGIERDLAGYPVMKIVPPDITKGQASPDIWNKNDPDAAQQLAVLQKMVKSVRRDEQEGMVLPWWVDFELVSTGSRRSFDTNSIIARYDQRIAMSVMADFIMLGHEAVGSKALAATKISLFTSALSSFLDTVCSIVNRHAIATLMRFNGWPTELSPVMTHGDVESVDLQQLGDFIQKLSQSGFNMLAGPAAQEAVMGLAKLPTTDIPGGTSSVGDSAEGEGDKPSGTSPVEPSGSRFGSVAGLEVT